MIKIQKAIGTTGVICRSLEGKYFFRVYDKEYNFVDYDLVHNDLLVTIMDTDASFYETDNGNVLDHSPETLGK